MNALDRAAHLRCNIRRSIAIVVFCFAAALWPSHSECSVKTEIWRQSVIELADNSKHSQNSARSSSHQRKLRQCHIKPILLPEIDPDGGMPVPVWITDKNAVVRSCPDMGVPLSVNPKFMRRFFLASELQYKGKTGTWLFLLKTHEKTGRDRYAAVGWIKQNQLLQDPFPMVNIRSYKPFKAIIPPTAGRRHGIPLYGSPSLTGTPKAHFSEKAIAFIYQLFPDRYGIESSHRLPQDVNAVLVSLSPSLNAMHSSADNKHTGWIPAKHVRLWGTNLAVRTVRSTPVYNTLETARKKHPEGIICRLPADRPSPAEFPIPVIDQKEGFMQIQPSIQNCPAVSSRKKSGFIKGWIKADSFIAQENQAIRPYVFFQKQEMLKLSTLYSDLFELPQTPESVELMWAGVINTFTDEACEGKTRIEDCFRRSIVVNYTPRSSQMMQHSLDDLVYLTLVNRKKFSDIYCDLKKTDLILKGILSNQKHKLKRIHGRQCEYKSISSKPMDYWFSQNGFDFAWIAISDLP